MSGWSRGEGLYQPEDKGPADFGADDVRVEQLLLDHRRDAAARTGFTRVDDASRAEPEAVIGHRVWQVRFNGDPNIIGRRVTINEADYVVVGVTPEDFRGHTSGLNDGYYQLWLPLSRHPRLIAAPSVRLARDASWLRIIARLPGGTTVAQADAMVQSAVVAIAARYPSSTQDRAGGVEPYFPPEPGYGRKSASPASWCLACRASSCSLSA